MRSCVRGCQERTVCFRIVILALVIFHQLFVVVGCAQQQQGRDERLHQSADPGTSSPSPSSEGPVGWWTFGEGSGVTAADSSGNGRTALLVNGVSWIGNAIATDASVQQYVRIPPIDLTRTRAVTIALWVNRNYSNSGKTVLLEATPDYRQSTTGFAIYPDSAVCQGLRASLRGDGGFTSNCYSQPSSGVWHHLAVVFDKSQTGAGQIALYVDGVQQAPSRSLGSATNTNNFGNDPIYLFSRGGIADFDSGAVADVRVYDTALSSQDIQAVYIDIDATIISRNPGFSLSALPSVVTLGQGSTGVSTITAAITGGFNSDITLGSAGVPMGTTVGFSPNPIPAPGAGTSTMTINVGANTPIGSYPITVIGTAGGMQRQTFVTLNVTRLPQVLLTWDPSKSQVIGYNAYRSLTTGGPYSKINSSLIPGTTYTDLNVQSGFTYYYVTTAVDSQQRESGYSNEASATVP